MSLSQKKLIEMIISNRQQTQPFASTVYLFYISDSNTFMLGDSNRHTFKLYSDIKSVKF